MTGAGLSAFQMVFIVRCEISARAWHRLMCIYRQQERRAHHTVSLDILHHDSLSCFLPDYSDRYEPLEIVHLASLRFRDDDLRSFNFSNMGLVSLLSRYLHTEQ
jgi:hypothetical protein